MSPTSLWIPHPHATYHLHYPDDRREVLCGDAVDSALVAAPAGTRVWMQGASGWGAPASTLLRGRWTRETAQPGVPLVWISERAHAERIGQAWDIARLGFEPLEDLVVDADPQGTWLPGEPAYLRGAPASDADIERWAALLESEDPQERVSAIDLLTAATNLAPTLWDRLAQEDRMRRLVGLLSDADRRVVAGAGRILRIFGDADGRDVVRKVFTAVGGADAWMRALTGPPDEAFGWVGGAWPMVGRSAVVHTSSAYVGLVGAVESGSTAARTGALDALSNIGDHPTVTSPLGQRLAGVLETLAMANERHVAIRARAAAGQFWKGKDSSPNWLLPALVEELARAGPTTSANSYSKGQFDHRLDSPWLDKRITEFLSLKGMAVCLACLDSNETLTRILKHPEGVRAFIAGGGSGKIRDWAEGDLESLDLPMLFLGCLFDEIEEHQLLPHRKELGKALARDFCWARVRAHLCEPAEDFPEYFYFCSSALGEMAFVAADELARLHAVEIRSCIDAFGRRLSPAAAGSWVEDELLLTEVVVTFANLAPELAFRSSVKAFLPQLRNFRTHSNAEIREHAERAIKNCE